MARFPYHERNVAELGKLIARASLDRKMRNALEQDPSSHLAAIGLPDQTVQLMTFKVIDQKAVPNAVALPFRLNSAKLERKDAAYLQSLGNAFSLN